MSNYHRRASYRTVPNRRIAACLVEGTWRPPLAPPPHGHKPALLAASRFKGRDCFPANGTSWLLLKILTNLAGSLSLHFTGVVSHLSPSRCTPLTSRNEHGSSRRGGLRPLQRCVRSSAPPFTFTPLLFNICQAICPRHCSPQATCRVMRRLPSLTIDERLTHCRIHLQTPARVAE